MESLYGGETIRSFWSDRELHQIDNPFEHKEKSKDRYESILINLIILEKI